MNCETIKLYYYDCLEQADTLPEAVKTHVEQCPFCRKELERLRNILEQKEPVQKPYLPNYLQLHYQLLDQWVSCGIVKPFLPSLLIPELVLKRPTPVTAHIENCPACKENLEEIASLRLTASELITAARYLAGEFTIEAKLSRQTRAILNHVNDRDNSTVLTRMRLDPQQVRNSEQTWLSDAHAVDVEHRQAAALPPRRIPHRWPVPVWATSGIAAAILLVILLMIPMKTLKALDLSHLYATLENVQNVHIQRFEGQKELENIWISENLQARLIQQDDTVVFWDKRSGRISRKSQGSVELVSQGAEMELERPWGLLPFKQISELPPSYDWGYISEAAVNGNLKVQVYELTWKVIRNQVVIERKWRGYLDVHSHLPYRIEWLDKVGDSPYQLVMTIKVSYPSDAECQEIIEKLGFQRISYGDQEEFFEMFPAASNWGTTEDGLFLSTCPSANAALNIPEP